MIRLARGAALFGVALALAGCDRAAPPDDPGAAADAAADISFSPDAGPSSLAEIAPGDTGAIIGLMRRVMTEGDAVMETAERRDTTTTAAVGQPRRLTLFTLSGQPLKLVAAEPEQVGNLPAETAAWFVAGEVRVVQGPFDAYFLDGDRLVLWTDASLVPIAVPETDRMEREREVVDSVRSRLERFGIRYP
ncbi:MAG: hypothetical protein SFU57_04880 [Gemmatimonadales bacterium]|nr:hypothetical protein [Gemmatimonadales bacterium]